jgi:hypothetical protein
MGLFENAYSNIQIRKMMINHQTWGGKHLHMVVKKKQSLIVHSRPESSKLLVLGKKTPVGLGVSNLLLSLVGRPASVKPRSRSDTPKTLLMMVFV